MWTGLRCYSRTQVHTLGGVESRSVGEIECWKTQYSTTDHAGWISPEFQRRGEMQRGREVSDWLLLLILAGAAVEIVRTRDRAILPGLIWSG